MAEKPILFSGEMVRAILDGRKTQTRRVVDFARVGNTYGAQRDCYSATGFQTMEANRIAVVPWTAETIMRMLRCPYGVPGDKLWVREAWAISGWHSRSIKSPETLPGAFLAYAADGIGSDQRIAVEGEVPAAFAKQAMESKLRFRWRPSIHMPRWASRLTLEIVSVRVEKLQDISEEDARAEGIIAHKLHGEAFPLAIPRTARQYFQLLWQEINGAKHPWESNPWVWAISFRRAGPEPSGEALTACGASPRKHGRASSDQT